MMKRFFSVALLCVSLFSQVALSYASNVEPKECPKELKYLLGMYYGNREQFIIRERGGELEILYRTTREDYKFAKSNHFPLKKEKFDSYTLLEAGPMNNSEVAVRFERDANGYGTTCKIGGNRYSRAFFTNDADQVFRLPERKDWQELKANSKKAIMPVSLAQGKEAKLVNLVEFVPNIKLDLRYSSLDNCFGFPIVENNKALLDQEAALALAKVQIRLADYGYGLVVWEAYRPWSATKLAYDAFPEDKKSMLPAPEKGFSHNKGRSIDVSLYYLSSGEKVEMISDFDEPSVRQYKSFSGGTELARYQRDLLANIMALEGFEGTEMEWWHFDYQSISEYASLNV